MTLLSLFHRIRDVPARFWSEGPLFDFAEGTQPLAPGAYRSGESNLTLAFDEDHYAIGGGAWPGTLALIPAGPQNLYIHQQSDGYGVTFYGAARVQPGRPGFEMFSPEPLGLAAVDLAIGNGAEPSKHGCAFGDPDMVTATILGLLEFTDDPGWDHYLPAP